jgi:hypothetical protein
MEPEGITSMPTLVPEPSFIRDPEPYCFSIWSLAASRAFSFSSAEAKGFPLDFSVSLDFAILYSLPYTAPAWIVLHFFIFFV